MDTKKLITPKFRVTVGDYELSDGMEVECVSSSSSNLDWCRVELSTELEGVLEYEDMDEAIVELGYGEDYDVLLEGYVRKNPKTGDYWKELLIKDDLIRLERIRITASFVDCTPTDILRYILTTAGITDYQLSEEDYGKRDLVVIDDKNGIEAVMTVNSTWGIQNPFFFQHRVFYWGVIPDQEELYVLEEDETILSLQKYGDLWEAETIGIPWIHHSQEVEVVHSKVSGIVRISKVIVKSDRQGEVHMYLYFPGGGANG